MKTRPTSTTGDKKVQRETERMEEKEREKVKEEKDEKEEKKERELVALARG